MAQLVDGEEIARVPTLAHSITSESGDAPRLVVETFCFDHSAAGGLPASAETKG